MYSYEIIFGRDKEGTKENLNVSEAIIAEEPEQVLRYASERLKLYPEDELIAIIRRNAIIKILSKDAPANNGTADHQPTTTW